MFGMFCSLTEDYFLHDQQTEIIYNYDMFTIIVRDWSFICTFALSRKYSQWFGSYLPDSTFTKGNTFKELFFYKHTSPGLYDLRDPSLIIL